jgi:hypothetical protein
MENYKALTTVNTCMQISHNANINLMKQHIIKDKLTDGFIPEI